jgi:hypothetical protein
MYLILIFIYQGEEKIPDYSHQQSSSILYQFPKTTYSMAIHISFNFIAALCRLSCNWEFPSIENLKPRSIR